MKNITVLVLFLFAALPGKTQIKEENSLFWEITGNGLQKPSYLFGTIHMICKDDFFMPSVVKEKFSASGKIFLEMDMDDASMQVKLMKLAMLPQGESLPKIFGKDYAVVDSFFKANASFPLAMFNQFKPMMVMSMMYMEMLPCENSESYEGAFMAMAKEQGKDILGLETIEDQMKIFDDIPDSLEARNILKMITEFDKQKKQFTAMVEVYKQQNINQLQEVVESSPDLMDAEEALLTKRNNNWIPVMETNMKEAGCFFAVGAAHLGGTNGVITLLRKRGYSVKAVNAK
jgi:uncharacterized protein